MSVNFSLVPYNGGPALVITDEDWPPVVGSDSQPHDRRRRVGDQQPGGSQVTWSPAYPIKGRYPGT